MADPKSRARVERLLRGDFHPDDLTALFLYARDHCDGREALTDIGHFVAHHHERDRGIITRSTRDWFSVARFHMPRFGADGVHDYIASKMPTATRDYFKIAIKRIGRDIVKRETGLLELQAHDVMQGVVGRLTQNADGTWALPSDLTRKELKVVTCACSFLVSKPAFDDATLFSDFLSMLKSNALITKEELIERSEAVRPLVYLFAVAAMHNSVVQVGDGSTTKLTARFGIGEIHVEASVPGPAPDAPNVDISSSMFTAHVDPTAHCHPDLVAAGNWAAEIELGSDGRLSPLR